MALYWLELEVPPNTPENNPVEQTIDIEGALLERIEFCFPPGCAGTTRVAVFYGPKQLSPRPEGSWARGDGEEIADDIHWPLPEREVTLRVKAWSSATSYKHTIIVRFYVSAKPLPELAYAIGEASRRAFMRALGFIEI